MNNKIIVLIIVLVLILIGIVWWLPSTAPLSTPQKLLTPEDTTDTTTAILNDLDSIQLNDDFTTEFKDVDADLQSL